MIKKRRKKKKKKKKKIENNVPIITEICFQQVLLCAFVRLCAHLWKLGTNSFHLLSIILTPYVVILLLINCFYFNAAVTLKYYNKVLLVQFANLIAIFSFNFSLIILPKYIIILIWCYSTDFIYFIIKLLFILLLLVGQDLQYLNTFVS